MIKRCTGQRDSSGMRRQSPVTRSSRSDGRNGDGVPATILDGRALAADLRTELVARTNVLRERGLAPRLAIVFVGENESSLAYVRNLARTGERAGISVVVSHLPAKASVEEVRAELEELRDDPTAHGVMLQQP